MKQGVEKARADGYSAVQVFSPHVKCDSALVHEIEVSGLCVGGGGGVE